MNRCKVVFDCNELTTIEDILNKAMDEIQTLREQVAELKHCVENRALQWAEQHMKIAELEANLSTAVETLEYYDRYVWESEKASEALAKIKGE